MYTAYNARPIPKPGKPSRTRKGGLFVFFVLVILSTYTAYALLRPMAAVTATILPPVIPARVKLATPWPAQGQAAIGADEYGVLAANGEEKPVPTASVAKVITALAILDKKPLQAGSPGPMITLTAQDVSIYNEYVQKDGSVVPVLAGEKISLYQALQAMMLPSANNIADTTAIWAFGSIDAYAAYANQFVKKLGMTHTTVTDASGFSPQTVSTARDLVILGDAAMDHPVLSEIVGQKAAEFPNHGIIRNVNSFIGQAGIRGIKTGNTEQAGGCYLAAADAVVGGRTVTIITAIMGAPTRPQAMQESIPLIQSASREFKEVAVVRIGEGVGYAQTPWGSRVELVAANDVSVLNWAGKAIAPEAASASIPPDAVSGTPAGTLTIEFAGKKYVSSVKTKGNLSEPTTLWRLTHPI